MPKPIFTATKIPTEGTSSAIKERIDNYTTYSTRLTDRVDYVCRMMRQPAPLRWDSPQQIVKSLRYLLTLRSKWFEIRTLFLAASEQAAVACGVSMQTYGRTRQVQRSYSQRRSYRRSHRESEGTVDARELTPVYPGLPDIMAARAVATRIHDQAQELDNLWSQSLEQLSQLPEWKVIKKLCPIGGRDAYSVLIACRHGKLTDNLADQHKLFGWLEAGDLHNTAPGAEPDRIPEGIRMIKERLIGRAVEKRGQAPNCKRGMHLLTVLWAQSPRKKRDFAQRRHDTLRPFADRHGHKIANYERFTVPSATILLAAMKEGDAIAARITQKIGVNWRGVNVQTVLTGRPQRVLQPDGEPTGTDFYAEACWTEQHSEGIGIHRKTISRLVHGVVLMRSSWPDVYHLSDAESITNYEQFLNRWRSVAENFNRPEPNLHAYYIWQLNASSTHYFQRQQQEAIWAAEKAKTDKQKRIELGQLVRKLRNISCLTTDDSFSVGNCKPGTYQFMRQLGMNPDNTTAIDGRSIARYWAKKGYIDQRRFEPVVLRLLAASEAAKVPTITDEMLAVDEQPDNTTTEQPTEQPVVFPQENIPEQQVVVIPSVEELNDGQEHQGEDRDGIHLEEREEQPEVSEQADEVRQETGEQVEQEAVA